VLEAESLSVVYPIVHATPLSPGSASKAIAASVSFSSVAVGDGDAIEMSLYPSVIALPLPPLGAAATASAPSPPSSPAPVHASSVAPALYPILAHA